ncbi:unnamed protein product [Dovyalis caffra]|uniref:Uncharacterized protein n=1 Tax=Dovyalis caffra TaxID=77055 RepID=A0AAV1RR40_9ROSI|nr:unnamed protein product [Dovyalis caffra]
MLALVDMNQTDIVRYIAKMQDLLREGSKGFDIASTEKMCLGNTSTSKQCIKVEMMQQQAQTSRAAEELVRNISQPYRISLPVAETTLPELEEMVSPNRFSGLMGSQQGSMDDVLGNGSNLLALVDTETDRVRYKVQMQNSLGEGSKGT